MTAMLPAHLTESLNNLGDAAGALADEVRADKEHRAFQTEQFVERQRKQNRRVMALLVTVAVLVGALTLMAVGNRLLHSQNKSIVERIESCTTAGGECYEQNSRRTGDVVATVIRADIYTHRCLVANPKASDVEIQACVYERLRMPAPTTTP